MAVVFGLKYKFPMEIHPLALIDEETELQGNQKPLKINFRLIEILEGKHDGEM